MKVFTLGGKKRTHSLTWSMIENQQPHCQANAVPRDFSRFGEQHGNNKKLLIGSYNNLNSLWATLKASLFNI